MNDSKIRERRRILVLVDKFSTHINTVRDHLEALAIYSKHDVHYVHAINGTPIPIDLSIFDIIIIHYSVRIAFGQLSEDFATAVRKFPGPVFLFIQDEYENHLVADQSIIDLNVRAIFTCVPEQYLPVVYPQATARKVDFVRVLTGYVPAYFDSFAVRPLAEREVRLAYRGRTLPFHYGNLGREKMIIGQRMKEICSARGIAHDIAWDEGSRIYGRSWLNFLGGARATIGTESGSNVLDANGGLAAAVNKVVRANPTITYEEIFEQFLTELDGRIIMNQISPRVFEAIALRTALVLFEGDYSGIVKPEVHYIPLKKDFSNADGVLARLENVDYLSELTERAHRDIIGSGKYSYARLAELVDQTIDRHAAEPPRDVRLATCVTGSICDLDFFPLCDGGPAVTNSPSCKALEVTFAIPAAAQELRAQILKLQATIECLKGSWSWRIGRTIVAPFSRVKRVFLS